MISFDGPAKIATLSLGTTALDVLDIYSRWKDWVAAGNAQYPEMFRPIGGDPIDQSAGTSIPLYAFMTNGWRIRPQAADHTLNVTGGVLLVDGGGDPFINPLGSYAVRISYSQPVQAITVSTGGGSGGATAQQVWDYLKSNGFASGSVGEHLVQRLLDTGKFLALKD
jgi:hypothetical protein